MAQTLSQTAGTDIELGFTSLQEETEVERLPVTGEPPAWLGGALVRVTPAMLEVGERRVAHWFDGLAMLNRFGFADGEVSYRSRFLRTRAFREAQEGRVLSGFATDPCRTLFQRVQSMFSPDPTDNANVNLARIGARYIAMTETPLPVEFDPETLETLGHVQPSDRLGGQISTAHPHHDRARGELVNQMTRFSARSEYVVYGMADGSAERRAIARVPARRPAYMHSFATTADHIVLTDCPLRVNPLRLALSGRPFIENYVWEPGEGVRFRIIDRASGRVRGSYETEAFFCFHHVNAFERASGSELVVDLVAYEDPSVIDALYLDGPAPRAALPPTELRRYVIGLDSGTVRHDVLAANVELPRIAYGRHNGRDYRYAYCTGHDGGWIDRLVKVDVGAASSVTWSEAGCYPGEPVFVRDPAGTAEDDGIVLSVVLDARAGRSFLLVLDAGGFHELARAQAPHHIPFGFHGVHLEERT